MSSFWTWAGNISSLIGIIGTGFSIAIWFRLKRETKKAIERSQRNVEDESYKEMVEFHSKISSTSPYVFCVSLTERADSIKKDVENYFKNAGEKIEHFEELQFQGLTHENFPEFVMSLKKKRRFFQASGATEILLFISGPMQAAVMIGAIFDNWIPVKVYNFNPNTRKYEYWCPLIK